MFKIAISAAVAAIVVMGSAAPAFARTDAENQRCLAVGQTMTGMGKTQKEIVTMLREGMTNPTAEDKETLTQLDELAASTQSVGEALEEIYAAAPKPTEALLEELNKTGMDELINEAEKCVD